MLRMIGLLFMMIGLSACSTIKESYYTFAPDRDVAYLDATVADPLVLPEGMTVVGNFQSPYVVPAGPLPGPDAQPLSLVPPGGKAVWDEAKVQVAKEEAAKAAKEAKEDEEEGKE